MEWITELIRYYDVITKQNPLVATMAIPVIGGLMFYLKGIPGRIWGTIVRYTTVSMTINNAGYDGNIDAYNVFDKWFMRSGYKRFSRSFFMFRQYHDELFKDEEYRPYRLGIGLGYHIFFHSGRLFWFQKYMMESSGSEKLKESIDIYSLGWNHRVFEDLVELFNSQKTEEGHIAIHSWDNAGWKETAKLVTQDLDSFTMNKEVRSDIVRKVQNFIDKRDWYLKKGLTHKTSFLFYGPPGTGKTTLSRLLAMKFLRDIYRMDLSAMTNETLVSALASMKPGSFLLIEDVDKAGGVVRKRGGKEDQLAGALEAIMGLTMSGFLNAFDGVVGLDNIIVLFTTNHPELLDPAIRRKSRIDNEVLIDLLTTVEIEDYVFKMYDDISDEHRERVPKMLATSEIRLPGCEIENAYKENPDNPILFLADINSRYINVMPLAA